jgi:signal transduction histidine kinase
MEGDVKISWVRLRLSQMRATTELLATSRNLQEVLSHLARRIHEVVPGDFALLVMFDEAGAVERFGEVGLPGRSVAEIAEIFEAPGPFQFVCHSEGSVRLDDIRTHPAYTGQCPALPEIGPFIGACVRLSGRVIGSLFAARPPGAEPFTEMEELAISTLALQSAANISNMLGRERQSRVVLLEERTRIAGDLHQGIVETLDEVTVELQSQIEGDGTEGPSAAGLTGIAERLSSLARGVADYAFALQSEASPTRANLPHDLAAVLRQAAPQGVDTVFNMKAPALAQMSGRTAEDLLFIAREAITNAIRHGSPTKVAVDLREVDGHVALTVQDDGVGFDAGSYQPGLGMTALRNRVERINGKLAVVAIPGMGTTVRVTIPIDRDEAKDEGEREPGEE